MSLRFKFVLPINIILGLVLGGSIAWEWQRLEQGERSILYARLSEETRFVEAAARAYGITPSFTTFLTGFCRATDRLASPEHQVALLDRHQHVLVQAAVHAHHPIDLARFAQAGEGFWPYRERGEHYLVRVSDDGDYRVVIVESTRALQQRVWAALENHLAWALGMGVLLLATVNIVMRRAVLRPIRRLYRAAHELERGRLGAQVEWSGRDEFGSLSRQFNAMSQALALQEGINRRELEAAEKVQSHLLPPVELRFGDLVIAGRCLQKGPVGGDIYDVRVLPDGRVSILIADLSGHNVAAALNTALVRGLVGRESERAHAPAEVLEHVNRQLCDDLPEDHFATAFLAWIDPASNRLCYANAGHPAPLLRTIDGPLDELSATGPPLGVLEEATFPERSLEMKPGSVVILYTDGLTEARNRQGVPWESEQLADWLRAETVEQPVATLDRLLERDEQYRGGAPREDDVTAVVLQRIPDTDERAAHGSRNEEATSPRFMMTDTSNNRPIRCRFAFGPPEHVEHALAIEHSHAMATSVRPSRLVRLQDFMLGCRKWRKLPACDRPSSASWKLTPLFSLEDALEPGPGGFAP